MAGGGGACARRPASVGGRGRERGRRVECARGGPPSVGRPVARGGRRGPRREAVLTGHRADAGERRRAGIMECPRGGVVGGEARGGVVECLRGAPSVGRPMAHAGWCGCRGERRCAWGIVSGAPPVMGTVSGAPPARRAASGWPGSTIW